MAFRQGLGWYLGRLSVMGPREIAHRVAEQLTLRRLAAGHGRFVAPVGAGNLRFFTERRRQLPDLPWDDRELHGTADALLDGQWPALGFPWRWSAGADTWRRAPDTGAFWPGSFFGAIPYRPGNPFGDVRVAWEPARLQQLVSLARLARRDEARAGRAVDLLERQLLSWVDANPPWAGVHYVSAMECALRLIAVCHAVDLVRDRWTRPAGVAGAVATIVASHGALVSRRLSLHSSAGNHTVAESAGLVYAGLLFPELPGADRWLATGLALLTAEFERQVLDDGGGLEQALWYLLFVTDLAGLVERLLRHHGRSVPGALLGRLERARGFLGRFASGPAGLPAIGDSDDGSALGPDLRLSFPDAGLRGERAMVFRSAGYTIARTGPRAGVELVFDHGPFGMPPSFGHAHADALSIVLRRHDRDLMVDPGTCTYSGDPEWRRYFRSTPAHNTVTVNGLDQAVQETPFQWSSPAAAALCGSESHGGRFRALGVHDGYLRAGIAVRHWRGVALEDDGRVLVWDRLEGQGEPVLAWHWHLAGSARRQGDGDRSWELEDGTTIEMPLGTEGAAFEGSLEPRLGWRSRRYGCRESIVTLRASVRTTLPWEGVTRITPAGAGPDDAAVRSTIDTFRRWLT